LLASELDRLEQLYRTAAEGIGPGERDLPPDAWTALVAVSDAWTAFRSARGQLFREIKLRDLPVPADPRRVPQPATPGQ
jgi:hypothetical protein